MTTRTKALYLMLASALLSACVTTSPSPNLSNGSPYNISDFQVREVRRDVMNRYVCTDGQPIFCSCNWTTR